MLQSLLPQWEEPMVESLHSTFDKLCKLGNDCNVLVLKGKSAGRQTCDGMTDDIDMIQRNVRIAVPMEAWRENVKRQSGKQNVVNRMDAERFLTLRGSVIMLVTGIWKDDIPEKYMTMTVVPILKNNTLPVKEKNKKWFIKEEAWTPTIHECIYYAEYYHTIGNNEVRDGEIIEDAVERLNEIEISHVHKPSKCAKVEPKSLSDYVESTEIVDVSSYSSVFDACTSLASVAGLYQYTHDGTPMLIYFTRYDTIDKKLYFVSEWNTHGTIEIREFKNRIQTGKLIRVLKLSTRGLYTLYRSDFCFQTERASWRFSTTLTAMTPEGCHPLKKTLIRTMSDDRKIYKVHTLIEGGKFQAENPDNTEEEQVFEVNGEGIDWEVFQFPWNSVPLSTIGSTAP